MDVNMLDPVKFELIDRIFAVAPSITTLADLGACYSDGSAVIKRCGK